MTTDELAGRIFVLEALVFAALGGTIRFGRAPVPTEHVISILNGVKRTVELRLEQEEGKISPAGKAEAKHYLDYLLSEFSEYLIPKRPDQGPQTGDDKG